MVINMEKLERKHYLKHYLGGPTMILSSEQNIMGKMEQVDMEDGSVSIQAGEKSTWVDGDNVTPVIKSQDKITDDDIKILINNLLIGYGDDYEEEDSFPDVKLDSNDIDKIKFYKNKGVIVTMNNGNMIRIRSNWRIESNWGFVQNIGTIIFLLCEMGFDVTGQFNK